MKIRYTCQCGEKYNKLAHAANCCGADHPLKMWRKQNGMNQEKLAEMLGKELGRTISRVRIAEWETGRFFPQESALGAIYRVTKIDCIEMYIAYRFINPE